MRRWVRWTILGCLGYVACGGSSVRRGAGEDDGSGDDQSVGGTAGAGGATAGTSSNGGAPNPAGGRGGTATSGRGGTTTGGRGGSTPGGGGPSAGGEGALGGEPGTGGDAGGGGAPSCMLAGGISCTFQAACDVLGCGTAWSQYTEHMCVRTSCAESGLCEGGERCVAAPVAGRFDEPCGNQADSCDTTASGCECLYYEECFPSAVCLPVDEYPPENDCPIADLDCVALGQARMTLQAYLNGDAFLDPYEPPGNIASSLRTCLDAVDERFSNYCAR